MTVLELAGLRKEYRTFRAEPTLAVDGLDLVIEHPGTVVGFLGPNGSGKTTTIRCMLGLIRPTAGTVRLLGEKMPSGAAAAIRRVGALVEQPKFFGDFTGRRNLRLLARIGGYSSSDMDRVLELVGLTDAAGMKFHKYSFGMKQRLAVAATLLKDPDLLVLDEPANGLDPAGIVEMRRMLRDLADSGKTVFVSSHQLGEIEQVCDRIVIINRGEIVGDGTLDELRHKAKDSERTSFAVEAARGDVEPKLKQIKDVTHVECAGEDNGCASFLLFSRTGTSPWREVSDLAQAQQWKVKQLGDKPLTLEETFLTLTEKAARAAS